MQNRLDSVDLTWSYELDWQLCSSSFPCKNGYRPCEHDQERYILTADCYINQFEYPCKKVNFILEWLCEWPLGEECESPQWEYNFTPCESFVPWLRCLESMLMLPVNDPWAVLMSKMMRMKAGIDG